VRIIYEDSEGTIWVGTYDQGLVRIKDRKITSYTMKEGLFNNGVFQILEDARENFWISSNLGIYRVSKKELTDYAEGHVKSITSVPYGKRDGMISSECNGGVQPAGVKTLDGKLWFPTQAGVVVVDPDAVPVSAQPPPVMIEEFLINNEPVAFGEVVKISPGTENFEIHYTGLSFIMSERIGFKYKLEGLDRDWVDAGTRRIAYYSHVPPGNYTFKVIAANRDGIWNLEGASIPIRIIPPFWKTWWFVSLSVLTFIALVWVSFRLRIAQLEKERRAQESFSRQLINSQESERQRIAAELHDSLGQHLLIIKNSALLGINVLNGHDRGKEQLSDISETASRAIDEVREISYNLRPYQLDDLGLTKAIEYILAKVASSSKIRFSSELDRIDDVFSPEAEINIYRIVQESLNNIVKHSRAESAKVSIKRDARHIDIIIQDDGRGLDTEKTNGGFGLKGISERARILGAKYVIHSAAGQGTTITLSLEAQDELHEK
jgi:signal transduction histidine kinase